MHIEHGCYPLLCRTFILGACTHPLKLRSVTPVTLVLATTTLNLSVVILTGFLGFSKLGFKMFIRNN